MNTYRCNPDGAENVAATKQHEREVFALKMQAKYEAARNVTCGIPIEEAQRHENYRHIPPRVLEALYRYVGERHPTGGFLAAVLSNDLFQAVGRADDDSFRELRHLIRFIYNEVPHACHGSPAKVSAWTHHPNHEGAEP